MTITEQIALAEALRDMVKSVHTLAANFETPDTAPLADYRIGNAARHLDEAYASLVDAVAALEDEAGL